MMVNGLQIKMARAALGWGVRDLASESNVAATTVTRIENEGGGNASTLTKIRTAFEQSGVVFIGDRESSLEGGPGVRLGVGGAGVALATKGSGKAGKRSATKAKAGKGRKRAR